MEIGEYVRTINGDIGKINNIDTNRELYFAKDIELIIKKADIKAHSKNIIDLIEVGDYVNGYLVTSIAPAFDDKSRIVLYIRGGGKNWYIDETKSILTHEQYEENSYKVVK